MADAGFESVLNYTAWYGSAEEVQAVRRSGRGRGDQGDLAAQRPRLEGRHGPGRLLRILGPDCDCDTNSEFKEFALGLVKDHPATWGFYVGDELMPTARTCRR